jgi:hypothetical protein
MPSTARPSNGAQIEPDDGRAKWERPALHRLETSEASNTMGGKGGDGPPNMS